MTDKHTPGPWGFWPDTGEVFAGNNDSIAMVLLRDGDNDNARLIAAAPNMLDALVAVDRQTFCECPVENGGEHEPGCFVPLVRAAIARAKGETI